MDLFQRKKGSALPSIILAIVCAAGVVIARTVPGSSILIIAGTPFAFSDIFIIIAGGIGGLLCGMTSFSILFVAELFRLGGDYNSLYSLSTYLVVILLTARLSYIGGFKSLLRTMGCTAAVTMVLAICWKLTFTVIIPIEEVAQPNALQNLGFGTLLISALPETVFSVLVIFCFFRLAPDPVKALMGSGWVYMMENRNEKRKRQVLAVRVTALSLLEAFILCIVAMICSNLFEASAGGALICPAYFFSKWNQNLRMTLLIMSAGVPIAYFFTLFILKYVVRPVNAMSSVMDRYFETDERGQIRKLPDLEIHTKDEVEQLYHSLEKMVADMSLYIERVTEQEKKTAHLTKGFMAALAKAVDEKDHYTSGHSTRVAKYSKELAKRMGKTDAEQEEIYVMGLLHDIGKIGVPESIINKKGRLTEEEFQKIKEHPAMGSDILKNVEELPKLATGARWHHERFDGRGYPDGLSGMDIPEEARIIAVADAYDAMTSNRAYSNVRPQEEVRSEIERCRGSQFDPKIADLFIQMIDDDIEYQMHE